MSDPVTVRLVEAAPVAGALRFEMLSEGRRDATARILAKGHRPERAHKRPGRGAQRGAERPPARHKRKRGR